MSLNLVRSFSATARRAVLKIKGKVTLEDVKQVNGPSGETWAESVQTVMNIVEEQYPGLAEVEIQGAKAHKPSKDPSDPNDVITLGFYSSGGTRWLSGHVHEDATYKLEESRSGKGKGGSRSKS
ncbi:hypothetical protein VTK26DRAFT_3368 [Humicola hyalothermophila]